MWPLLNTDRVFAVQKLAGKISDSLQIVHWDFLKSQGSREAAASLSSYSQWSPYKDGRLELPAHFKSFVKNNPSAHAHVAAAAARPPSLRAPPALGSLPPSLALGYSRCTASGRGHGLLGG